MILTNKQNLPKSIVKACEDKEYYSKKDKRYSVTELLKSTREIILSRRFTLVQDVADRVNALLGSAVHKIFEENTNNGKAEEKIEYTLENGYTISGIIDLYDEENSIIIDYKTSSVSKIQKADFDDWKEQCLVYAWLKLKNNIFIDKIIVYALLKDWSKIRASKDINYPQSPFYVYELKVTDYDLRIIETKLRFKIDEIIRCEKLFNYELPLCTEEERWNTGDKYAILKKNAVRAYRVVDTLKEAENISSTLEGSTIEIREGEDIKCRFYCPCAQWCIREEK